VRFFVNPAASRATYSVAERKVVSLATGQRAREELSRWDDYNVTPLRRFHDAAAEAGLADIFYKDESGRFGLGSFKALGGAYAAGLAVRRWLNAEHGTLPADHPGGARNGQRASRSPVPRTGITAARLHTAHAAMDVGASSTCMRRHPKKKLRRSPL